MTLTPTELTKLVEESVRFDSKCGVLYIACNALTGGEIAAIQANYKFAYYCDDPIGDTEK